VNIYIKYGDNLPSEKHERLLTKVIDAIKEEGYTVVRLDKREIPDAFYIENGKPVAIEIETDISKPFSRLSEFDKVLLVNKELAKTYHSGQTYKTVLELRKENKSYREIQTEMQNVHGIHIPISLIHSWIKGTKLPKYITVINY